MSEGIAWTCINFSSIWAKYAVITVLDTRYAQLHVCLRVCGLLLRVQCTSIQTLTEAAMYTQQCTTRATIVFKQPMRLATTLCTQLLFVVLLNFKYVASDAW
jgi:hypothetical protein